MKDTSAIDRALILCDAYYEDKSSVANLYLKTGKDVLIKQVPIIATTEYRMFKPHVLLGIAGNKKLCFSAVNYNAVFYMDLMKASLLQYSNCAP